MIAMTNALSMVPVIAVDEDKCVNCHMCIAVCPVKYCIDGSGEKVSINADLCIGCGSCVKACTQKARYILDDAEQFFLAVGRGEKIVAIVAPAVVSSFPGQYRRMLGWLKRLGVAASFDVSFGAELTVKSYVDHIKTIAEVALQAAGRAVGGLDHDVDDGRARCHSPWLPKTWREPEARGIRRRD